MQKSRQQQAPSLPISRVERVMVLFYLGCALLCGPKYLITLDLPTAALVALLRISSATKVELCGELRLVVAEYSSLSTA